MSAAPAPEGHAPRTTDSRQLAGVVEAFPTQLAPTPADDPPWEGLPAFLTRVGNSRPAPMLVEGILPGDGLTLLHADPRSLKTWLCLELALAVASNRPACGELATAGPAATLYVTNEDSPVRLAERLRLLLAGHGLTTSPRHLFISAHRGLWLDDADSQARLVAGVKAHGVRLVILDPLRSLTGAVDAGPRELQPFAGFLRTLAQATGCAVLLSHHNVKPQLGQTDTRRRPYRASGGGIFSVADAPLSAERIGDSPRIILTPAEWKFRETPGPLEVALDVSDQMARLTATPVDSGAASVVALEQQILSFLDHAPGASGSAVARGTRTNKAATLGALESLSRANRIDSVQDRRGTRWFLRREGGAA